MLKNESKSRESTWTVVYNKSNTSCDKQQLENRLSLL